MNTWDNIERIFFIAVFGVFGIEAVKNWSKERRAERDERVVRDYRLDQMLDAFEDDDDELEDDVTT